MTALLALVAHPGHGTTDASSVVHWLAEPLHAGALLGLVAAAAAGVYLLIRPTGSRERA